MPKDDNFFANNFIITLADAVLNGDTDLVRKRLAQTTIEINQTNESNMTPLMLAAQKGHLEIVRILLDHGASIDEQNSDGMTALMLTTIASYSDIARELLDRGADPVLALSRLDPHNRNFLLDRKNIIDIIEEYIHTPQKQKAVALFFSGKELSNETSPSSASQSRFFLPNALVSIVEDYARPACSPKK